MSSFTCSFCQHTIPLTPATYVNRYPYFRESFWASSRINADIVNAHEEGLIVTFYKCPKCGKVSVLVMGVGSQYPENYSMWFYPDSKAKVFPDYIPEYIRQDYQEACKIVSLSPKASATLSRRCLQSMIRDKWNINEKTLYAEIDAIKNLIDPDLWRSIDALRKIGNIGAHMNKDTNVIIDVDPEEAIKLVSLIEILIHDWYVVPHQRNILLNDIIDIADQKK